MDGQGWSQKSDFLSKLRLNAKDPLKKWT